MKWVQKKWLILGVLLVDDISCRSSENKHYRLSSRSSYVNAVQVASAADRSRI
jgi:hypothetical protein